MLLVTLVFHFFSCELGKMAERPTKNKLISKPLLVINTMYVCGLSIACIVLSVRDQFVFSCDNWIWLYSAICGLVVSCILVVFALKMNYSVKKMNSFSASLIDRGRYTQLWYGIFRIFIGLMLFSYATMLADSVVKIEILHSCTDYTGSLGINVLLFAVVRLVTHYSVITYCLYVFWPSKFNKVIMKTLNESDVDLMLASSGDYALS